MSSSAVRSRTPNGPPAVAATPVAATPIVAAHAIPFPYDRIPLVGHLVASIFYPPPQTTGLKFRWVIDTMKGGTLLWSLGCLSHYNAWQNNTAVAYASIHGTSPHTSRGADPGTGTYGVLWLLKSYMFPDPKWEERIPVRTALAVVGILGGFWYNPLALSRDNLKHTPTRIGLVTALWGMGVFMHFCSDMYTSCLVPRLSLEQAENDPPEVQEGADHGLVLQVRPQPQLRTSPVFLAPLTRVRSWAS